MKALLLVAALGWFELAGTSRTEPSQEEIRQLINAAGSLYEALDAVDYEVQLRVPEIEELMIARTGGLLGAPQFWIKRHSLTNTLSFSFPELPQPLRAKAEDRAAREAANIETLKAMHEVGWTLFGSFIKSIDPEAAFDVLRWDDKLAVIECNDLSERFLGKLTRSCRFTLDRRRSTVEELTIWLGQANEVTFTMDYDAKEFFPGTQVPLVRKLVMHQHGFKGPAQTSLIEVQGKYMRSAEAVADEQSTSLRAQLKRAGFTRAQIDRAQVQPDGTVALNFENFPLTELPSLAGLPISSLDLSKTQIRDLKPLQGLALRTLLLDETPVMDLAPLAGMPLERLSLRRVAAPLALLRQLPLKRLDLSYAAGLDDLALLSGLQLEELAVEGRPLRSLQPLAGMPLRELLLNQTQVSDLSPLRGLPLLRLEVSQTGVRDLTPLVECHSLIFLRISQTGVEDLAPLAGLRKLEQLRLGGSRVRDLAPLRGLPLRELSADNLPVADLTPLLECPTLERLCIPRSARPIEALKKLPALQELSFRWDASRQAPSQSAAEFWREMTPEALAANRTLVERLAALQAGFETLSDGTLRIDLKGRPIADLAVLADLPISDLSIEETAVRDLAALKARPLRRLLISRTEVTDLAPLSGMPLAYLDLTGCPVADLRPLAGMKLEELKIGIRDLGTPRERGSQVSDLSPLRGLPCKRLAIDGTQNPDLSPLAECRLLEDLVLPKAASHVEALRQLPNLRRISWGWPGSAEKMLAPAEFWRQYELDSHKPQPAAGEKAR